MINVKKLIYIVPIFLIFAFAFPVAAANNGVGAQAGDQIQQQDRIQDPSTHTGSSPSGTGNQVKNTNQVSTQNMGESSQLQVATSEMKQLMEEMGTGAGIGAQVRTIAQEQVQAQAQIQSQISKMESKSNFMKGIFGPNYKAIENVKAHIERNMLRIQALTELKNQISNQADETALESAIQALTDQNTRLQEQVDAEEGTGSLFGWLAKLFAK